jgi:uncharacterized protein (DUF305 family)
VRTHLAVGVVLLGLALSACGDDTADDARTDEPAAAQTASNGDVFNDADVAFASDMVQHHAQAVQMVVMAQGRPLGAEAQALAERIRETQVPEIELLSSWLTAWGQEVPETSLDHANAGHDMDEMDHGSVELDLPGAMSADEMAALEDAADADFEQRWLQMMVEHHRGAVEMARTEQADGTHEDAVALAGTIVETQQAELGELERLLG